MSGVFRRIVFALAGILLFSASALANNTILLVGMFDTNDGKIGVQAGKSEAMIQSFFGELKNEYGDEYEIETYILDGDDFTADALRKIINSRHFDSTDKVMFYYVGHGNENEDPDVPFQVLHLRDGSEMGYSALRLVNALQSRQPGFMLAVFEACNAEPIGIQHHHNYNYHYVPPKFSEDRIKALFDRRARIAIVTASKEQYTWLNDEGGIFTNAFIRYFKGNDDTFVPEVCQTQGLKDTDPGSASHQWEDFPVAMSTPLHGYREVNGSPECVTQSPIVIQGQNLKHFLPAPSPQ